MPLKTKFKKFGLKKFGLYVALPFSIIAVLGIKTPQIEIKNEISREVPSSFNVMTANVARGEGKDFSFSTFFSKKPQEGFRALEDVIKKEKISLACFQEIEHTAYGEHQPKQIAENTHLKNYLFSPNFAYGFPGIFQFADGNAVISHFHLNYSRRESLDSHKSFSLSSLSELIVGSKSILSTKIKHQQKDITIVCTHLSNWDTELSLSEKERDAELEALFIYAVNHTPAIILGDLNTVPLSAQKKRFSDADYRGEHGWERIKDFLTKNPQLSLEFDPRLKLFDKIGVQTFHGTYHGTVPEGMLGKENIFPDRGEINDYIFVLNSKNDAIQLKLVKTKAVNDKFYSDHVPVIAEIKIKP